MLYIFPFFLPFHLTAFLCSQTLSFSWSHFLVFFPLRPVSPFSHSHSGVSKVMAPNSSTLAWQIPWAEEPGRLQSVGSQRVGHNWATSLSLFTLCIGEGNGNPLQCSCLENPRDGGAGWAAVYGVAQSRTRLRRLSSISILLLGLLLLSYLFLHSLYLLKT